MEATDTTIGGIIDQYFQPNLTMLELQALRTSDRHDPLSNFSQACRLELQQLHAGY